MVTNIIISTCNNSWKWWWDGDDEREIVMVIVEKNELQPKLSCMNMRGCWDEDNSIALKK
jgi:hypothetical protein